jgi:sarcosine oxidase subunit gamma
MAEARASQPTRVSPLGHLSADFESVPERSDGSLHIGEVPFFQQLNLRLDPVDGPIDAVELDLGMSLPLVPGSTAAADDRRVLWLGPDEWLIVSPPRADPDLETSLRAATAGGPGFASVVDISSLRTIVEVAGSGARGLLAHGCALDLHPRVFQVGQCAQTKFAQANVVIYEVDRDSHGTIADHETTPVFWILVRASFAAYLGAFLLDAVH